MRERKYADHEGHHAAMKMMAKQSPPNGVNVSGRSNVNADVGEQRRTITGKRSFQYVG